MYVYRKAKTIPERWLEEALISHWCHDEEDCYTMLTLVCRAVVHEYEEEYGQEGAAAGRHETETGAENGHQ